jgi:anhydro-N-acetylmuramic acid kinase
VTASELYIGLMSGTSLDGVDGALLDFSRSFSPVSTYYAAFDADLRAGLAGLNEPGHDELARSAMLANRLTERYAEAVAQLLSRAGKTPRQVRAIGCHGQTVRHRPDIGFTLQLLNAALLAERSGIAVVSDFRSRDVAAGGQGAPLVPAFHAAALRDPKRNRAVVNLGGIANLTWLPRAGTTLGFDCGPGNALLDEWVERHLATRYDDAGRWAAGGRVLPDLLQALAAHPYFERPPPKSTGRDLFSLKWVQTHIRPEHGAQDVQATLAELSAVAIGTAVRRFCPAADEVLLCGGGVANADLVARIQRHSPSLHVASTAEAGLDPDWVEAVAFAWLARETLAGRPGNLPAVTGAAGPRVLGCVYPA